MPLIPGSRLGPYEILAPLGAGGMGEVYKARDTRLERTVAIKVLNSQLIAGPEVKARFDREAKVISQLQHAHICVLHDVGSENGTDFLVMEYLEGEPLSERLKRGALPIAELLKIAVEIADALDKAHRAGIVHRDLKPGNIMLTKSGAKLLDFGLAKPRGMNAASASGSGSIFSAAGAALTMTSPASPLSSAGAIIGTVQYMSPEQIAGQEADARSDVFAFGLLLFEMATGKRAFEGTTQASIVGSILAVEAPAVSSLAPRTTAAFDRLVRDCLKKDPDERLQSVHDLRLQLQAMAEAPGQSATQADATAHRFPRAFTITGASVLLLAIAAAGYFAQIALEPKAVVRAFIHAPDGAIFSTMSGFDSGVPSLSPDGTRLAFVGRDLKSNRTALYVRPLNSVSAQLLTGTEGATYPFWSPDSRSLGFFAEGKLKRMDVGGGPPQTLCDAPAGRGGTWNRDGVIVFAPFNIGTPLMRVNASGGTTAVASKLGSTVGLSARWPQFLPDGKHFLFYSGTVGDALHGGVLIGSLDSLDPKVLLQSPAQAIYVAPGYLLFVREGTLLAQPFNARTLQLTGEPVPIAEHIAINGLFFVAMFSASDNGMLAYQTGDIGGTHQLQWLTRDGKSLGALGDMATYYYPAISPDGKRVATSILDVGSGDIWVYDVARNARTRLTFGPSWRNYPVWTPDGKQLIYQAISVNSGQPTIFRKSADGSGSEEVLLEGPQPAYSSSISSDGKYLVYYNNRETIWALPLQGEHKPFSVMQQPGALSNPTVSPDGKWLAYNSSETGKIEIYVTAFPNGGARWQVSNGGGITPRWRGDSKELYFMDFVSDRMMAVDVTAKGASIEFGTPHALFSANFVPAQVGSYDVTADGKRFLVNMLNAPKVNDPLTLVTNWTTELKKK